MYKPAKPLTQLAQKNLCSKALGFALAELSLAIGASAAIVIAGFAYWSLQIRDNLAQATALQYQTVNDGVQAYMARYSDELVQLPLDCGNPVFQEGAAPAAPDRTACELLVTLDNEYVNSPNSPTVYVVRNGLQPSVIDLAELRLFNRIPAMAPAFTPQNTVFDETSAGGAYAPYRFAIAIQPYCAGSSDAVVNNADTSCLSEDSSAAFERRSLRSLVFNSQPFLVSEEMFGQLATVNDSLIQAGAQALVSTIKYGGELRGIRQEQNWPNPLRREDGQGVPNVLAMFGEYDRSVEFQALRRDGSALPNTDVDFAQEKLTNVNKFETTDVDASDQLRVPIRQHSEACDVSTESIALDASGSALMRCEAGTWRYTNGKGDTVNGDFWEIVVTSNEDAALVKTVSMPLLRTYYQGQETALAVEGEQSGAGQAEFVYKLALDPAEWGAPSIMETTTLGNRGAFEDTWCDYYLTSHGVRSIGGAEVLVGTLGPVGVIGAGPAASVFGAGQLGGTAGIVLTWGVVFTSGGYAGVGPGVTVPAVVGGGVLPGVGGGSASGAAFGISQGNCVPEDRVVELKPIVQTPEVKVEVVDGEWTVAGQMNYGGRVRVRFHKLND